jgi:methionine sulfoxide reductase heme-binding subunit
MSGLRIKVSLIYDRSRKEDEEMFYIGMGPGKARCNGLYLCSMAQGRCHDGTTTTAGRINMVDRFYTWITSHRTLILRLFWLINIFLIVLIVLGFRIIILGVGDQSLPYRLGSKAADLAVLFLIATSFPGIARRMHVSHKLIMLLMLFRRQLGISTFFFALTHVCLITIFPEIHAHAPLIAPDPQNLAGWATFLLLIPLFVTSNNFSIKKMGIWWHRLHLIMYGVLFILVFHTFFSEESWFFLIGMIAVVELGSLIYEGIKKRKNYSSG